MGKFGQISSIFDKFICLPCSSARVLLFQIFNFYSCRDTASAIVKSNYWQEALRNHTLDLNTGRHDTPMRKLIRKMPGRFLYVHM